ncbi:MAG: 4Fe-4S binding protein [Candidatus Omnitrophota bacterium]|jgi:MauM/NapG family ferredoxin protein
MKVRKLILLRRASQVLFFLLFAASSGIIFKIDPLAMFFTSISERAILPGIILSCIMILLTYVLGRFFCGWVCPLGASFDLIGLAAGKRRTENKKANARHGRIKYILLAVVALSAILGIQVAWVLDPLGIMSRFVNTFPGSPVMAVIFLVVCSTVFIKKRFWCRSICPLGALYALAAKAALLGRKVRGCSDCGGCASRCRMGAIKDDSGYSKGECILCMDCVYDCPALGTKFTWGGGHAEGGRGTDTSRRNILILLSSSVLLSGFGKFRLPARGRTVIRPPAALPEEEFTGRCIRCGNCMRVCITNGLQPSMGESGISGIWTPKLVPEIGYCEYNCTLCGNTCPTGAIHRVSLAQKHDTRLGLAAVDRNICISWADGKQCMVCEEHCPVPDKAIKAREDNVNGKVIRKPLVDGNLCVGCGICQNKCPVNPVRAIRVRPF